MKNSWKSWNSIFQAISQSQRIVVLHGEITKKAADTVITQILELEARDKSRGILFCLNSNGGDVKAGMAIHDVMQLTACHVATLCFGQAASMAVLLLAAGARGQRMALPGARIMFHQPWNGLGDPPMDKEKQIKRMILLKELLNDILYKHTDGFLKNVFPPDFCGKFFLTAQEAKAFHLIDHIVSLSEFPHMPC